jgi:hypothetical protein
MGRMLRSVFALGIVGWLLGKFFKRRRRAW